MRASKKLNGVYITSAFKERWEEVIREEFSDKRFNATLYQGHIFISKEFDMDLYGNDWKDINCNGVTQSIWADLGDIVANAEVKTAAEISQLISNSGSLTAPAEAEAEPAAVAQAQAALAQAAEAEALVQAAEAEAQVEAKAQAQAAQAPKLNKEEQARLQASLISLWEDIVKLEEGTVNGPLKQSYEMIQGLISDCSYIAAEVEVAINGLEDAVAEAQLHAVAEAQLHAIQVAIEKAAAEQAAAEQAAAEQAAAEKAAAEKAAGAAAKAASIAAKASTAALAASQTGNSAAEEAASAQAQAAAAKKPEKKAANKVEGKARAEEVKVPNKSKISRGRRKTHAGSGHSASTPAAGLKSSDFDFLDGLMTSDVIEGQTGIDCANQCVAIKHICSVLSIYENIFSKADLEIYFKQVNIILKEVESVSRAAEYINQPKEEAPRIYYSQIAPLVARINIVLVKLKQKRAVIIAEEKVVENRVEQAAARVTAKANKKEKINLFKEKRAADQGCTARAKEEMGDNQPDILAAERAFNDYTKENKQYFFDKTSALSNKPEVTGGQSEEARDAKLFLLGFAEICLILLKEYTKVTYVKAEELVEFNKEFSIAIDGVGIVERNMKTFPLPDAGHDAKQLLDVHWNNVEKLGDAAIFGKYGLLAQSADAACGRPASLFSVDSSSEDDSESSLQAGGGSCFGNRSL